MNIDEYDDAVFTPLELFMLALAEDDVCPRCLGELDTGWECDKCGYDAEPLFTNNLGR